jgi:multidrug efflux pump subunit AcrA (membrane-fusion protein)
MTQQTENPENVTSTNSTTKVSQHAVLNHAQESDKQAIHETRTADFTHMLARRHMRWLVTILGLAVITVVMIWQSHRPKLVSIVQPTLVTITESLTTTGRVGGVTEASIGAQATGIVERLLVREGDDVAAGQQLAILKRDVAEAQAAQAQAVLNTARAQLAQAARGPLPSDVEAAAEDVRQAQAQLNQQRAAVIQATQSVAQARAQYSQLETERDLILKEYTRSKTLAARGFISQAELDQVQANSEVAEKKLRAQAQALAVAQANVTATQAAVEAAQANTRAQEARLQTIQAGARSEDILVAQERVEEAEYALQVARQQAANAIVTAPFAGVVTAIHAEVGQTVGSQGVLQLVSHETEIRVDVDESNLADLAMGQAAILSSNTFRDSTFQGTVTEIAAAVDATRGTVTVTIIPTAPPDWLRPGQTVNVNIITNPAAKRLLVPKTATTRVGDRTGVLVVKNGRALYKTVVVRPPIAQGVPVLAGLTAHDYLIANSQGIEPGDAVRTQGHTNSTTD